MTITEQQVKDAFRTIWAHRENPALNYAVGYAMAGQYLSGNALYTQVLYVLNNMGTWRGNDAKLVRNTLKTFAKEFAKEKLVRYHVKG